MIQLRSTSWTLVLLALLGLSSFARGAWAKDGDLDPTFGAGTGRVLTVWNPTSPINGDLAFDLLVQPDRKIVVGGWVSDITDLSDFALARYNPDGTLDPSFGGTGLVRAGFGFFSFEQAFCLLRQPDGKLVIGGWTGSGLPGGNDLALMRFLANGQPDSTFGSGGKVSTNLGGDDWALDLVRLSDGKLLVAGRTGPLGNHSFLVARYLSNGTLDTAFGTGGKVVTNFPGRDNAINKIAVLPDGKILAIGFSIQNTLGGTSKIALARYTAMGKPDTTFGTGGKVLLTIGRNSGAADLALLAGGKFLVAGAIDQPGSTAGLDFALMRFLANGKLDPTFGTAGRITTPFTPRADLIEGLRVLRNGKILVAGEVDATDFGGGDGAFGLARYTANGQLDTTFGTGGKVITRLGTAGARATALAIQADGKALVTGHVHSLDAAVGTQFGVARYLNTQGAVAAGDADVTEKAP